MPLGLDIKSILVGVAFAYFVLPWIMSMLHKPAATPNV